MRPSVEARRGTRKYHWRTYLASLTTDPLLRDLETAGPMLDALLAANASFDVPLDAL